MLACLCIEARYLAAFNPVIKMIILSDERAKDEPKRIRKNMALIMF